MEMGTLIIATLLQMQAALVSSWWVCRRCPPCTPSLILLARRTTFPTMSYALCCCLWRRDSTTTMTLKALTIFICFFTQPSDCCFAPTSTATPSSSCCRRLRKPRIRTVRRCGVCLLLCSSVRMEVAIHSLLAHPPWSVRPQVSSSMLYLNCCGGVCCYRPQRRRRPTRTASNWCAKSSTFWMCCCRCSSRNATHHMARTAMPQRRQACRLQPSETLRCAATCSSPNLSLAPLRGRVIIIIIIIIIITLPSLSASSAVFDVSSNVRRALKSSPSWPQTAPGSHECYARPPCAAVMATPSMPSPCLYGVALTQRVLSPHRTCLRRSKRVPMTTLTLVFSMPL
eukprot:PhM_4_TR8260/c0_g1_i2/m.106472